MNDAPGKGQLRENASGGGGWQAHASSDFLCPRVRTVSPSQPQHNAWNAAGAQTLLTGWLPGAAASAPPAHLPRSFDILLFSNDTRLLSPQVLITINTYGILKSMPGSKIRALHSLSRLIPTRRNLQGEEWRQERLACLRPPGSEWRAPHLPLGLGKRGHWQAAAALCLREGEAACPQGRAPAFLGCPSDPGQAPVGTQGQCWSEPL